MISFGIERIPVGLKSRMAGVLYFLSVLIGGLGERFLHGRLAFAVFLISILGMAAMTLLFYGIFKPVNKNLSLLAASFGLVGIAFEALRFNPQGVNIAIVCLGFFCLLIGHLVLRSTFLPRILAR